MSSEIRTRRNGLRLMLQGLGRNLRGGARLALFMPVRLSDFRISVGQFTLVYLLGVLAWLLGGMAREGLSGGLNLPALGQSLAQLPLMLMACFVVGLLHRRSHLMLALATLISAPDWLLEATASAMVLGLRDGEVSPLFGELVSDVFLLWAFAVIARALLVLTGWRGWRTLLGWLVLMVFFTGLLMFAPRDELWSSAASQAARLAGNSSSVLDEDIFSAQDGLLASQFSELQSQRSGVPDVYFLGVAASAREDVFVRELSFVKNLFDKQWDSEGRSLALANSLSTLRQLPLATATNLRNSLSALGEVMDVEDDLLVLYLTSHGTPQHQLSVEMPPMRLAQLTPATLASMLSASAVNWKVIIISACYAGGYIEALRDPHTLIITAAAADRASFGCENGQDFTWFGKAYFADALAQGLGFVEAFERASRLVSELETANHLEASQPQLVMGEAMAARLPQLEARIRARTPGEGRDGRGGSRIEAGSGKALPSVLLTHQRSPVFKLSGQRELQAAVERQCRASKTLAKPLPTLSRHISQQRP